MRFLNLRTRWGALASGIALIALSFPSQAAEIGSECEAGFGSEIAGVTSRSQSIIHSRVFVKQFHSPKDQGGCRDDVHGLININGANPEVMLACMREKADCRDDLGRIVQLYGLDRALSASERQRVEKDAESLRFRGSSSTLLHLPLYVEGIAVATNLPCPGSSNLKLNALTLANIYSGATTNWREALQSTPGNPNEVLTDACYNKPIRVAVRADSTGQSVAFKDYLSKAPQPIFDSYKQEALNTQWPPLLVVSCRGRGDAGMATCVSGQPGSIGYVGFAEAFRQDLQTFGLENRSGAAPKPSFDGCTTAAAQPTAGYPGSARLEWSNTSLVNPPFGYAICTLQFAFAYEVQEIAYEKRASPRSMRGLKDYLKWAVSPQSQSQLKRQGVAPLPDNLRQITADGADSIRQFE